MYFADPLPEPEQQPMSADWAHDIAQEARHLAALRQVLAMELKPPTITAPEGLVYVGGGKYWPGIVVGIRMLRDSKNNMPVQVWHRGDDEPVRPEQVLGLGNVQIIDAVAHAKSHGGARILRGWESKLYALTHCNFERVLYLDADAYVVENPAPFMAELNASPFVFWHDLPNNFNSVRWDKVWGAGPGNVPAIQGGQIAIDRKRNWRALCVAHWMNQHSDYYYSHMFGDQDTWRVVFAALGNQSLWSCLGAAPWQNTAFVCATRDGVKRIVHRCQGKLFRPGDIPQGRQAFSSPQYALPKEAKVFNHFAQVLAADALSSEQVFGQVYERELWGTGSGPGSLSQEALPYVSLVNTLIEWGNVKSVVDLGCGDGVVGINLQVPEYHGVDCHALHIMRLRKKHPKKTWSHSDLFRERDSLPTGEVALLKDVLHHWPSAMVAEWLSWARTCGKWQRIVLTQDCHQPEADADCHLGGYRALSPDLPPLRQFGLKMVTMYLHKAVLVMECERFAPPALPS